MSASPTALLLNKMRQNIALDRSFLNIPALPRRERARYLLKKYRAIATNSGSIDYLGSAFAYDNRWTPALLQDYPNEIIRLDRLVDLTSARNVLDVGANLGQFAATAVAMFPHLRLWSLEPNPSILPLLVMNSARSESWHVVPVGVSAKDERRTLHFVPGKSGQGSVYPENAALGLLSGEPREVSVDLRRLTGETCEELGMPSSYDLIKIDVEGFEREALAGLRDLRWRFLAIETSRARSGGLELDELRVLVRELWGSAPRILDAAAVSAQSPTQDVVLGWPA
jgi:FkbM family methyltransferase